MNACGVLQVPVVMSIWDDSYGISVPSEYHTTRNDLSKALSGFQRSSKHDKGFELFTVHAWDYIEYLMLIQKQNILLENIIYHVLFMLKKLRNHKDIQLLDLMRDINLRRDYNGKKIIVVLKK